MEPATRPNLTRRGLTFIEVVCAVALLAIVAATVFGAFNSVMSAQQRQQHRLNAMEVANRLILQYLDDRETMPREGLPVTYAGMFYRWDMKEVPVHLEPARPDVAEERSAAVPLSVDRMQAIAVRVWLGEDSGGSHEYTAEVPAVALTRLMDPIAQRNPDTMNFLITNPAKRDELLRNMSRIGRNTGAGSRVPRGAVPSSPGGSK